jgi:hypothetical protein
MTDESKMTHRKEHLLRLTVLQFRSYQRIADDNLMRRGEVLCVSSNQLQHVDHGIGMQEASSLYCKWDRIDYEGEYKIAWLGLTLLDPLSHRSWWRRFEKERCLCCDTMHSCHWLCNECPSNNPFPFKSWNICSYAFLSLSRRSKCSRRHITRLLNSITRYFKAVIQTSHLWF